MKWDPDSGGSLATDGLEECTHALLSMHHREWGPPMSGRFNDAARTHWPCMVITTPLDMDRKAMAPEVSSAGNALQACHNSILLSPPDCRQHARTSKRSGHERD